MNDPICPNCNQPCKVLPHVGYHSSADDDKPESDCCGEPMHGYEFKQEYDETRLEFAQRMWGLRQRSF